MNLPLTATAQQIIQAFSWMLIHSLWQGLLLAVVTAIVLVATKRSGARLRYNLVAVQFLLFIAACCCTFVWEWFQAPEQTIAPLAGAIGGRASRFFHLDADSIKQFAQTCINYFTANAPMVVLLWSVLFVFRSVRMMGSLVYIHRAKNKYTYMPPVVWQNRVQALCEKLQINKAVRLLESGYVKVPMVIGHLKPVILIPVGLLAGLPAEQVEAVLLHELAHIRRHDYFVNFLQTLAETVFFFNPGLLWISSLLRDERENCCDDIALEQTKNKREFVQALISFKEHALAADQYAVAFPGKKNHLLHRVSRIMSNKNKTLGPSEKVFFMMGIIVLSVVIATAAIAQIKTMAPAVVKTVVKMTEHADQPESVTAAQVSDQVAVKATHKISLIHAEKSVQQESAAVIAAPETPEAPPPGPPAVTKKQKNEAEKAQAQRDQDQAERDREQAQRDREQAKLQQDAAKRDQEQALRDQHQAEMDQQQAIRDQEQAARDRAEAKRNDEQSRRNNDIQNKKNQEQVSANEKQAKRNAEQEPRNQEQARINVAQAVKNAIQESRNREQEQLNKEQAKKNEEQAKKDKTSVQE